MRSGQDSQEGRAEATENWYAEKNWSVLCAREVILSRNHEKHYTGREYFGYAIKVLLTLIFVHSKIFIQRKIFYFITKIKTVNSSYLLPCPSSERI